VTTPATSIRLIEVTDAEAIATHLTRDADAFASRLPARPAGFTSTPGQVDRIHELLDVHGKGGGWPGVILAGDVVIGQITVSTIVRGPIQKGFLGYWIATSYQGQGHAGRAVGLVLRTMRGELGLHRAEAHTQLDNVASHGVLRKNGFTPWGVAHAHIHLNGAWHDEIFWERVLTDDPPAGR
jgi:RimJ/RimL family protein N-acetyltransferase